MMNIATLLDDRTVQSDNFSTTTPNRLLTTDPSGSERDAYEKILPLNLFLAITIILQNSIVIYYYFPERKKLITTLFILIAAADVVLALGEILRSGIAVACAHDHSTPIPLWLVYALPTLTQLGWTCSVYFNVVLTLLRTVTLSRPFDGVNSLCVIIATVSGSAVWFLIIVSDFLYDFLKWRYIVKEVICNLVWRKNEEEVLASQLIRAFYCYITAGKHTNSAHIINDLLNSMPLILASIIPCLITLVCIPIQAYHLRISLSASSHSSESRDGDHITITIILVSSLFVLSNGFLIVFTLREYLMFSEIILHNVIQYTLPLLNGVGFQLIMILRKPTLRDRFKSYILAPIQLAARAGSGLIARYHGYQEVEVEQ